MNGDVAPLRVGCIGCGYIARQHLTNVVRHHRFVPHAYADSDVASADRFLDEFGGTYATESWQQVVEDPSVDVLFVCTPDATHKEIALAAVAMGKHVLMEKPLALSADDYDEVHAAFRGTSLAFVLDMKFRYSQAFQAAKRLMPRPKLVSVQAMMNPLAKTSWRLNPQLGGGVLFDLGIHTFDVLNSFFGPTLKSVYATAPPGGTHQQKTYVSAVAEFERGSASLLIGDMTMPGPASKWYVQAFDGHRAITISNHWRDLVVSVPGEAPKRVLKGSDDAHLTGALSRVLDALESAIAAPNDDDLVAARRAAGGLELVLQSVASGQREQAS